VYSTFKAIESGDENEQQKMLIYWAAYGSFSLVEVFTDKIISWFPLYYHVKFAFLVWLQLPTVEGSKQIYNNQIRPFLLRHQARVDQLVDGVYGEMVHDCFLLNSLILQSLLTNALKQNKKLQVKVVRSHQGEIRFVRAMIAKILGSVNEDAPRLGEIANGSPVSETNSDSESDSNHED
jgi:receptor expression-enhancing protein 5/6